MEGLDDLEELANLLQSHMGALSMSVPEPGPSESSESPDHICSFSDLRNTGSSLVCLVCQKSTDVSLQMVRNSNNKKYQIEVSREIGSKVTFEKRQKMIKYITAQITNYRNDSLNVGIPEEMIVEIADRVLEAQSQSTNNRGDILNSIIAGCAVRVLQDNGAYVPENLLSIIFDTKRGVSPGRNAVLTLIGAAYMARGLNHIGHISSREQIYSSIYAHLQRFGLHVDRNVIKFIFTLTNLNELLRMVDTQILITRVCGSLFYYFTVFRGMTADQAVALITSRVDTTKETINKYSMKMLAHSLLITRIAMRLGLTGHALTKSEHLAAWKAHRGKDK